MNTYTPTIGLEIHAELNTKSKMFCGCLNAPHESEVNANICPVCVAHPGTLPTVNEEAVKKILRFAYAVGGDVATYSEFDRKNYFYPDIPKAYQISQYAFPFVRGGILLGVELTRVHLEEDTARSQHDTGKGSVVDFNRAGVPLMELVTEPVIHDAQKAGDFAKELQLLLRTLGISDANMERGEMRVEANISVSQTDELGTKVEVKNLNSFRIVEQAIEFEVKRQVHLLEKGGSVTQETRGWDESKGKTFSQRTKETAEDYRYFPDPDIPKIQVNEQPTFEKSRIAEINENLPENKRNMYINLGLTRDQVETILFSRELDTLFRNMVSKNLNESIARLAANYLVTDLQPQLQRASSFASLVSAEHFLDLMEMLESGEINSRVAKDIIAEIGLYDADPRAIAEERGLLQTSSEDSLSELAQEVVGENPNVVQDYLSGKESALQFLVGQGMKKSRGAANPSVLKTLLEKEIVRD